MLRRSRSRTRRHATALLAVFALQLGASGWMACELPVAPGSPTSEHASHHLPTPDEAPPAPEDGNCCVAAPCCMGLLRAPVSIGPDLFEPSPAVRSVAIPDAPVVVGPRLQPPATAPPSIA